MIHQPWGGITGQASDIVIQAKEIVRAKGVLNKLLGKHTGHTVEQVQEDSERDYYMSAEEAVEYGVVDEIIQNLEDTDK
jgi:ATP-dependent Clp protease protease subunit